MSTTKAALTSFLPFQSPTPVSIRYPAGLSRPIPPSTSEGSGSTSQPGAANGTSTTNNHHRLFGLIQQPRPFFSSPSVGWPTTRPREEKSQHAAPPLPPSFFPVLFVSAKVLQSYETGQTGWTCGGERSPQGSHSSLGTAVPSPAALIPAPLAFHSSSFVVANSSMWTLHAPAETRRVCGYILLWFDPLLPSDPVSL